ncbi:MAG: hypothetical protein M1587_07190 [Thaumarchaeota archaeon]|nr:hypothetical protein [Nitrososphaerota archaeon]
MLTLQLAPNRKLRTEITVTKLSVQGFTNYVLQLEGTELSSRDDLPKELCLEIGLDGGLIMTVKSQVDTKDIGDAERIQKMLPQGFEFYHETRAAKMIKGVLGKYYHYRNKNSGEIISYMVGANPKPYRIVLGSINDPESKLRQVLNELPDVAFRKAELVHRLPQSIVENRQPIKAALDILEKEGYVKSISKKGISEEYVRTSKPIPDLLIQKTVS